MRPALARTQRLALAAHDEHVLAERGPQRDELGALLRRGVHRPRAGGEDAQRERCGDRRRDAGAAADTDGPAPGTANLRQLDWVGRLRRAQGLRQPSRAGLEAGAVPAPAQVRRERRALELGEFDVKRLRCQRPGAVAIKS